MDHVLECASTDGKLYSVGSGFTIQTAVTSAETAGDRTGWTMEVPDGAKPLRRIPDRAVGVAPVFHIVSVAGFIERLDPAAHVIFIPPGHLRPGGASGGPVALDRQRSGDQPGGTHGPRAGVRLPVKPAGPGLPIHIAGQVHGKQLPQHLLRVALG